MTELDFLTLNKIYYDGESIGFPLGGFLRGKYHDSDWQGIEKVGLRKPLEPASEFFKIEKDSLYLTVRGREPYYQGNRIADVSVPFTSTIGYHPKCKRKCFYIYVNREEIMIRLLAEAAKNRDSWFEIGEFSDLVAENRITDNLPWVIEEFAKGERGFITFATAFAPSEQIYSAKHRGRTIIRMKMNPEEIVRLSEPQTSPLGSRIHGINKLAYAGYPCGIVISPIDLTAKWKETYSEFFDILEATMCDEVKTNGTIELVFDKNSPALKSKKLEAAEFIINQSRKKLPLMRIIDIR